MLGKTPSKHYTEFLYKSIYRSIRFHQSGEDYLGRFYGEFMSYSGGDGQSLGIILTPRHITELFCELLDLKPEDKVLDPCSGTVSSGTTLTLDADKPGVVTYKYEASTGKKLDVNNLTIIKTISR